MEQPFTRPASLSLQASLEWNNYSPRPASLSLQAFKPARGMPRKLPAFTLIAPCSAPPEPHTLPRPTVVSGLKGWIAVERSVCGHRCPWGASQCQSSADVYWSPQQPAIDHTPNLGRACPTYSRFRRWTLASDRADLAYCGCLRGRVGQCSTAYADWRRVGARNSRARLDRRAFPTRRNSQKQPVYCCFSTQQAIDQGVAGFLTAARQQHEKVRIEWRWRQGEMGQASRVRRADHTPAVWAFLRAAEPRHCRPICGLQRASRSAA